MQGPFHNSLPEKETMFKKDLYSVLCKRSISALWESSVILNHLKTAKVPLQRWVWKQSDLPCWERNLVWQTPRVVLLLLGAFVCFLLDLLFLPLELQVIWDWSLYVCRPIWLGKLEWGPQKMGKLQMKIKNLECITSTRGWGGGA